MRQAAFVSSPSGLVPIRTLAQAALAACPASLLWRLWVFVQHAAQAVRYPNELDYGEGVVWQHIRLILAGRGYAPIDGFPTIVIEYPPLYHLVTGAVARLGGESELAAGRGVAVASTLLAVIMAGLIAGRLVRGTTSGAALIVCTAGAALMVLSCWPIATWGVLMRVDMLATTLSLGGLYLAMLALERPRLIHLAALAFVAALFTKQTMVAAPAAAISVLLLLRPHLALRGLATSILSGLAVLGAGAAATRGEFVRHLFLYNVNRFDLDSALRMIGWVAHHHWVYAALALIGAGCLLAPVLAMARRSSGVMQLRRKLADNPDHLSAFMALAYLAAAQMIGLLAGKSGASFNYLIEWLIAVCILAAVTLGRSAEAALSTSPDRGPSWSRSLLILVPLAIAWQASPVRRPELNMQVQTARQEAEYAQLSAMVRGASRPIISDDMVLLLQNGKDVVWEPAIFAELAHTGVYDERRIIRMIRGRSFAFFVTDGDRGQGRFDERYNPAVVRAMDEAYPRKLALAGHLVRLPRRGQ